MNYYNLGDQIIEMSKNISKFSNDIEKLKFIRKQFEIMHTYNSLMENEKILSDLISGVKSIASEKFPSSIVYDQILDVEERKDHRLILRLDELQKTLWEFDKLSLKKRNQIFYEVRKDFFDLIDKIITKFESEK